MSTPLLGAGHCGAGSCGAGIGEPATANALAPTFLRDVSGKRHNAPRIDPITRDLDIDELGNVVGADAIDQSVQLTLTTRRGSTLDPEFGLRALPGLMVPNVSAIARAYVNEALARMLARGLIQLVNVAVNRDGAALGLVVQYRNLVTTSDRRVVIPLS